MIPVQVLYVMMDYCSLCKHVQRLLKKFFFSYAYLVEFISIKCFVCSLLIIMTAIVFSMVKISCG